MYKIGTLPRFLAKVPPKQGPRIVQRLVLVNPDQTGNNSQERSMAAKPSSRPRCESKLLLHSYIPEAQTAKVYPCNTMSCGFKLLVRSYVPTQVMSFPNLNSGISLLQSFNFSHIAALAQQKSILAVWVGVSAWSHLGH